MANEYFNLGKIGGKRYAQGIINSVIGMANTDFMEAFLDRIQNGFIGWK